MKTQKPLPLESKIQTGYTEDGRIDMATTEGVKLFEEECIAKGISFQSSPLPDREANTRELSNRRSGRWSSGSLW